MTINYTTLLGLAQPVTGTETGQWGDVVNDEITSLLEDAVANAATFSVTSGNVTLTTTNGASNQARMSTLIITGSPGTTRNVIAPSQAKIYQVINQSDGAVVIKGSATTGVTIAAGATGTVVWNGSDFVEVNSTSSGRIIKGNLQVTGNLQVDGNTQLGNATSDTLAVTALVNSNLLFTDNTYDIGASGATRPRSLFLGTNLTVGSLTSARVPYASTGGLLVDSANLTFDGTNLTLGGGTANGVAYLNGSKVLTTGSALTFDGSTFSLSGGAITSTDSAGNARSKFEVFTNGQTNNQITLGQGFAGPTDNVGYLYNRANAAFVFGVNNSEAMRLTSTGLGIGTSSPSRQLEVSSVASSVVGQITGPATDTATVAFGDLNSTNKVHQRVGSRGNSLTFITADTERMRLDSSGNLGLGVTPSAWGAGQKAIQAGNFTSVGAGNGFTSNGYYNAGWKYVASGYATNIYEQNGSLKFDIAPSGTAGNAISFTQAMTLDASGNLGIGQTSMSQPLEIKRGSGVGAFIEVAGNNNTPGSTSAVYGQDSSGNAFAWNRANFALLFGTNNTERARINSSGDFLWGVTTGSFNPNGVVFSRDSDSGRVSIGGPNASGATGLSLYSTGAGAFRFYVSYAGQIYATSTSISAISDATLKENVRDLETGLTEVMALKPRRFDWKNGDAQNVAGFVAQEVEQVLPELVTDYVYNKDDNGNDIIKKSLKMGDILPTLVKAIQEQQAIINAQAAALEQLKAQLTSVSADVAALKGAA